MPVKPDENKILVVNADDLGLSEEIDAGIFESHSNGIVTSASIFPNFDYLRNTVEQLSKYPGLDVGPHVNLTWGSPLSAASSIIRDEKFLGGAKPLLTASLTGRLKYEEVLREIRTQLERFFDLGLKSTQVNTHQHVILVPEVRRALFELAPKFGFRWIRPPFESVREKLLPQAALNSYANLLYFGKRRKISHKVAGVLFAGKMDRERIARIVRNLKPGITELICHPAEEPDGENPDTAIDRLKFRRKMELDALTSPKISRLIAENQISLTNFRSL